MLALKVLPRMEQGVIVMLVGTADINSASETPESASSAIYRLCPGHWPATRPRTRAIRASAEPSAFSRPPLLDRRRRSLPQPG
jgi:hypothetical protein